MNKKYNRARQGLESQRSGAWFERYLVKLFSKKGWKLLEIKDGARIVAGGRAIRQKQPFDFIALSPDGLVYLFDAKSRSGKTRITPSMCTGGMKSGKPDSTKMQYQQFLEINQLHDNFRCGFVFLLKDTLEVRYVDVTGFQNPMEESLLWGKIGYSLEIQFC